MASNSFAFPGGDCLSKMGASWFISYSYYLRIDPTELSWQKVNSLSLRSDAFNRSTAFHSSFVSEILKMDDARLSTNEISLSASQVKDMAKELTLFNNNKKGDKNMNEGVITKIKYENDRKIKIQIRTDLNYTMKHNCGEQSYNLFVLDESSTIRIVPGKQETWYDASFTCGIGVFLNKKCEFEVDKKKEADSPDFLQSITVKADGR